MCYCSFGIGQFLTLKNQFERQLAVAQTSVSRKKVIDAYPESSKADFLHKEYLNIR